MAGVVPGLAPVFYLTRGRRGVNLADRLIIAAIVSPFVVVLVSFVEETLRIPQSPAVLALNMAMLAAVNGLLLFRFFRDRRYYRLSCGWWRVVAYGLFAFLLAYRLLPASELLTPLLHDPISHSEWLRHLNLEHFVTTEQWYPQGLEYYLNYYASFFSYSYPKIILMGNAFFLALFPVSAYYLGRLFFRGGEEERTFIALALLFVTGFLAVPNNLPFIAGKNSMILAFTLVPLLLYWCAPAGSSTAGASAPGDASAGAGGEGPAPGDRSRQLLAALLCFSVMVVHYPTGIFMFLFLFGVNIFGLFRREGGRLRVQGRRLVDYLLTAAVTAGLGVILVIKVLPAYLDKPAVEDQSIAGAAASIEANGILSYIYKNFWDYEVVTLGLPVMIAFIAALGAFVFSPDDERANKRFPWTVVLAYAGFYLLGALLLFPADKTNGIFYQLELRFFLAFVVLMTLAWFAWLVLGQAVRLPGIGRFATVLGMAALVLLFAVNGVRDYRNSFAQQEVLATTFDADLAAFDFIEGNISEDSRFLIQLGGRDVGVIMGADSGVWIPSYTGRPVEVDFALYTDDTAFDIYDTYIAVAADPGDLPQVEKLYCDYGISYIFFGSKKVFSDNMKREALDGSDYFEKVFDNGAAIYGVTGVDCD